MIDLFTIFSKGGLVLVWYINHGAQTVTASVNSLLKSIVLKDRIGNGPHNIDKYSLQYYMDNEFDLVYVVAYQNVLQLSYMDKFLTAIELKFRDKYKNDLLEKNFLNDFSNFTSEIENIFVSVKKDYLNKPKKDMMTYQESYKSSKTLKSVTNENAKIEVSLTSKKPQKKVEINEKVVIKEITEDLIEEKILDDESMQNKLLKLAKLKPKRGKNGVAKKKSSPTDSPKTEPLTVIKAKGKENRKWNKTATGEEAAALNYSKKQDTNGVEQTNYSLQDQLTSEDLAGLTEMKGQMLGELEDIDLADDVDEESSEEEIEEESVMKIEPRKNKPGMFGLLKSWIGTSGGGALTCEQMKPVLDNLKNHLIEKNVASEVAIQLCESVSQSLVGQKLGTFERVASKVKQSLEESCRQLLNCGCRVDILRDVYEARKTGRPYVITFCGVNGVGKSTNLAKISFWLLEQGFRVMIAACDTFRSGAVEQLRVHVQKLNYIHPPEQHGGLNMVHLYEKGYGKDDASVAFSAISAARDSHYDVVMIDTSGRMQDNDPLMRSLAKLITLNQPNLVLFVGEALVGHEAVDQLVKFNKALQDYSQSEHPRTIDGIVLTKFDTIDDKVGAAISMTYILGKPIMFVGTGQRYADLRQLSPESVVKSLMK